MKVYDVKGTEVREGIAVTMQPYPHIVLGEGGHKRATWIALGKRDAESILVTPKKPCPFRVRGGEQGACLMCTPFSGHFRNTPPAPLKLSQKVIFVLNRRHLVSGPLLSLVIVVLHILVDSGM